jgi:hypothetical protein
MLAIRLNLADIDQRAGDLASAWSGLPGSDRLVAESDRQARAPAQARIVGRPVGYLALLLGI